MAIHELFPYLCVRDMNAAVRFYVEGLGGRELFRLTEPSGRVGHTEVELGKHVLMISEEFPEYGIRAPEPGASLPFCIHLHVDDADAAIERAIQAGATLVRPPQDQFYGERGGRVRDPFGYEWLIGHEIEKVTPEEMQRRYTAMFA